MNDKITRGSTWSICFKFKPEQLVVQGPNKTINFFGEGTENWTLDEYANTATYHFSQRGRG